MAVLIAGGYFVASWFTAAFEYQKAMQFAAKSDYAKAESYISRAARRMPGVKEYSDRAHYIRGIHLLRKQQDAAAVRELEKVAGVYGHTEHFRHAYTIARLNHAWESDDYVNYLARAEELYALDPGEPEAVICMAAGNAYRYAQTGREDFRGKSEEYLARLVAMDQDKRYSERIARVRRCLETRVIPPH